jgi:hypothetical protein
MPLYVAGQRIRGNEINALPALYRTVTDQTKIDANYSNANGLAFQGEINAWYLVECFLFYHAKATVDIVFKWAASPAGLTGWWGADGIETGSTVGSGVGMVNRQSVIIPGAEHAFNGWDSANATDDVFANPVATMQLSTTPGTVQLQYRQRQADGANPIALRGGSAIRVSRLA